MSKKLFIWFLVAVLTLTYGNELDESMSNALSKVSSPNLICNDDGTYIICKRITSSDLQQMSKNGSVVTHRLELHTKLFGGVIDKAFGAISNAIQGIISSLQNIQGFIAKIPQDVFSYAQDQFFAILKWAGILYIFVIFGFMLAAFPVMVWSKLTTRRQNFNLL